MSHDYYNPISELTEEQRERVPYIEGRGELFTTKVLRISGADKEAPSILVAARDPGSGNALLPVIRELSKGKSEINIVTDGRAQQIIQENLSVTDITPTTILATYNIIDKPGVILADCSNETGIEAYATANFPEVPVILLEDFYDGALDYLTKLKERRLRLPDVICVIDEYAKGLIIKKFPDLEARIEITGQPAFDKFAQEDTENIAREVKNRLRLQFTDKLVSYMSSALNEVDRVKGMAEALKNVKGDFYFAFRRHPRDNTSYEIYKKILTDAGINVVDTEEFLTNEIGAASDVVLTTWSTEGGHAVYRRKPNVHITDDRFGIPQGISLPLVPVKLGASVGIDRMAELARVLPQLLEPTSPLNNSLQLAMRRNYPADGKNTQRVVDIVQKYIK